MRRHVVVIALIAVCSAGTAHADKESSLVHYDRGKEHYRAGRFAEAVHEFARAYELHPAAEYLYNIGQAHRRANDCRAIEAYRRYLEAEPASPHRALVEDHVEALRESCRPVDASPPVAAPIEASARKDAPRPALGASASRDRAAAGPWELRVEAGPAFYRMGEVVTPTVATTRLCAGAWRAAGPVELGAALSLALSPMRYEADDDGTALLASALANVSVGWRFDPRWRLRAELGAGALVLSGLAEGNPFTAGGEDPGALAVFDLRAAVGLDHRLGDRFSLHLAPAVYTRSAGHDDLAPDITAITSFAILAGVGARL